MYLDQRSLSVLTAIADNPSLTGKDLENLLSLSRKQLSYDLDKINYYLKSNGFEAIKRQKTGRFQVPAGVIEQYKSTKNGNTEKNGYSYTHTDDERLDWILLRLLCHDEALSVNHFIYDLQISKNTFLNDLKKGPEKN